MQLTNVALKTDKINQIQNFKTSRLSFWSSLPEKYTLISYILSIIYYNSHTTQELI